MRVDVGDAGLRGAGVEDVAGAVGGHRAALAEQQPQDHLVAPAEEHGAVDEPRPAAADRAGFQQRGGPQVPREGGRRVLEPDG